MKHRDLNQREASRPNAPDGMLGGLSISELDRVGRALGYLLDVERSHARGEGPGSLQARDPQGVGFEAFAVGAIERMCELAMRAPSGQNVAAVRYVAALLAQDQRYALERGLEVAGILARPELVPMRDAGRRSVDACLACDTGLGFYAAALTECDVTVLERRSRA
jgi:hypothetical protein